MKRLAGCSRTRPASASSRRRGATLVEVVALAAMAALAMALVVPALRAAQAEARRATCLDNLKLMGLAMHNYHAALDSFPMSCVASDEGHGVGHSGFTLLLPFMEEAKLYNSYNFSLENWHAGNTTSVGTKVEAFLCPDHAVNLNPLPAAEVLKADGKPAYPASRALFARSHYGMNWGGGHKGSGDDFLATDKDYRGVMMTVVAPEAKGRSKIIGMRDITDGASFTVGVAEKRDSQGWGVGGFGGSEFDVGESPAYDGKDARLMRALTGSTHPGVIPILFCDGSARALPSAVDRKVWYALMTRDGAEVIKLTDLDAPK